MAVSNEGQIGAPSNVDSFNHWAAYTPSANAISPIPRAIMLDADGTATLVDHDGVSTTLALIGKTVYWFRPRKITAIATATAVYICR